VKRRVDGWPEYSTAWLHRAAGDLLCRITTWTAQEMADYFSISIEVDCRVRTERLLPASIPVDFAEPRA